MATGATLTAAALVENGVRTVFGIPGAQTLELYDELASHGIECVPTGCERGAAFMACGHAAVSGRPAVLAIVPGAGLTHALSGIAEAFVDGHPMVVIVTAIRNDLEYRFQLHEMDQAAVVRPVAKAVLRADEPGQLASLVHRAFGMATGGPPGPVVVEVPANVFWQKAGKADPPPDPPAIATPSDADYVRAVEAIRGARKLAIYAGAGSFGAADALRELAEATGSPVATTLSGRGALPEDHALAAGFGVGPGGELAAARVMRGADTLLVVGARFAEVGTASFGLPDPKRVVQIDIDPDVIGANIPVDAPMVGDAAAVVPELMRRLDGFVPPDNAALVAELAANPPVTYTAGEGEHVHPGFLFAELRRHLPREAIVVCDSGSHTFWGAAAFTALGPRTFIAPTDYSSMGFGLPAAIGAAWATDAPVVAAVGDGGFRMSAMELCEAVPRGRCPKVIVFNDASYAMIAHGQRGVYKRTVATDINNPEFDSLAAAFRMPYARLDDDAAVAAQLGELLASEGPLLIEARVDPEALPPFFTGVVQTNTRRMGLGEKVHFGARMLKRALFGPPTP